MQVLAASESFGRCLRRIDAGGTVIRDTLLARSATLARHAHAAPYVCVVLDGRYNERAREDWDCGAGSVLTHGPGHVHANRIGSAGARCVNIEFDETLLQSGPLQGLVPFLRRDRHVRLPSTLAPLRRLAVALAEDDDLAPLSAHAAALDLLCTAARASTNDAAARRTALLERVVECLEADLMKPPEIAALATLADLHPHHLMRAFRQHRGETICGYVRRRRLERAQADLQAGDRPLVEIALRAGFCDQSHFTRAYRRQFGVTPGRARRAS